MQRSIRPGVLALILAAAGTASAHTGHGHDEFDSLAGVLHALSEPDHLAMLAGGIVVASLLAPRVLRALRHVREAWRARAGAGPARDA